MTFVNSKFIQRPKWVCAKLALISAFLVFLPSLPAKAAEDAKGFYLLGSNTTLSGISPPPGTYLTSLKYGYSGDATGAVANSIGLVDLGNLSLEADLRVDADIFIEIPYLLTVLPRKILGGYLGLGVMFPVGYQDISVDVDALVNLTLPNGTSLMAQRSLTLNDDTLSFGDPVALAQLGWHRGNWHWRIAGLLNIPIGDYHETDIANMGFNRWAVDTHAAVTWLDPMRGHEISVTAGFTFNGENPDTNYKTGTEFHVEWALMQNFSKSFAVGLAGYYYQQASGDSGPGATLGPFKGETTAIGPNINYSFEFRQIPVSTSFRWYHEFDTKNRLEGDAVYLIATIPLGAPR